MRKFNSAVLKGRHRFIALLCLLAFAMFAVGCGPANQDSDVKDTIVFGDSSWDSIKIHNHIAGFIVEHGYDYPVDYQFGESLPLLQGLSKGGVDIMMEVWADNYGEAWDKMITDESAKNLGDNFPDAPQGWYVPTYMIKGDPERGIEAMAPDLKSVSDLPKYWELFKDPEVPGKGRFHNSPPGWSVTTINETKFEKYGLTDTFNVFSTGSDAALAASMVAAYEKGKPWLGYYWEPTWVMGKLDMTMLEEPAYSQEQWDIDYACAYKPAKVLVGANSEMLAKAPELEGFLSKYETSFEQTDEICAYMNDLDGEPDKVLDSSAIWFLQKNTEQWKSWVPEDVAAKVEEALKEVE